VPQRWRARCGFDGAGAMGVLVGRGEATGGMWVSVFMVWLVGKIFWVKTVGFAGVSGSKLDQCGLVGMMDWMSDAWGWMVLRMMRGVTMGKRQRAGILEQIVLMFAAANRSPRRQALFDV
jgi:hypothetical protein